MSLNPASLIGDELFTLLILLFAGHLVADFLVQTADMSEGKRAQGRILLKHGLLTFGSHLLLMLPFWSYKVLAGVSILAVAHMVIDKAKVLTEKRWKSTLGTLLGDQAAHIACIFIVGLALKSWGAVDGRGLFSSDSWMEATRNSILIASGFIVNGNGGTTIVRRLLNRYPQFDQKGDEGISKAYAMGQTIGCLERFLVYTLVLLGHWGALGLVVAAKSIARFRELEKQHFADYYLIGTLASLLVAIASGLFVKSLM